MFIWRNLLLVLAVLTVPLVCSVAWTILPYDTSTAAGYIGITSSAFWTLPCYVTLLQMFFPEMQRRPRRVLWYCALTGATVTMTICWVFTLPTFVPTPMFEVVICGVYALFMPVNALAWVIVSRTHFRDRTVTLPLTSSHTPRNDTHDESAADPPLPDTRQLLVTAVYFAVYFAIGPSTIIILIGYLCLFSLCVTAAEQLFCNALQQIVMLLLKETILGFSTQRMHDPEARFIWCNYVTTMTDCLSTMVLSAMTQNTFIVHTVMQTLSMLSYVPLLSPTGIAIKEYMQSLSPIKTGKKTFADRCQNAGAGVFLAMFTQVIACSWYMITFAIMRNVPWITNSFPLAELSETDYRRAIEYAWVSIICMVASFWFCRKLAVSWYGAVADPLLHGLAMYSRFPAAMINGPVIAGVGVSLMLLRQARCLYFLYLNPGIALFASH